MRPGKGADWRWKDIEQYKPRDKITQKMTRDGLVEVNETRQTAERVSSRERDADFSGKKEPEAPQGKPHKQKIRHDPREQPQEIGRAHV